MFDSHTGLFFFFLLLCLSGFIYILEIVETGRSEKIKSFGVASLGTCENNFLFFWTATFWFFTIGVRKREE